MRKLSDPTLFMCMLLFLLPTGNQRCNLLIRTSIAKFRHASIAHFLSYIAHGCTKRWFFNLLFKNINTFLLAYHHMQRFIALSWWGQKKYGEPNIFHENIWHAVKQWNEKQNPNIHTRIYRRKTINSTEQLPISNWILMKTICDDSVFPIRLLCISCVRDNIIMLVKSLKIWFFIFFIAHTMDYVLLLHCTSSYYTLKIYIMFSYCNCFVISQYDCAHCHNINPIRTTGANKNHIVK